MQVILPDEQIHQIQLLLSKLIQKEIEQQLKQSGLNSPYLNKQQACNYLGISNNTLDAWIQKGLPAIKIRKTIRFHKDSIDRWLTPRNQKNQDFCFIMVMIFSGSIYKENVMTITKTKNGTYRLKIYIPIEARMPLGIVNNSYFDKRFKTRKEARQTEIDLLTKLNQIEDNEFIGLNKQEILFKDFYEQIWWEAYKAGQTTSTTRPPSKSTVVNTKTCFEKHLLPLLGNYTIQFLNQNKQVILNLMTAKANEYANFKTLRSYVISIFDWAEELEYIETNRLAKTLRRIKATKKIQLSEARRDEDLYLTQEQLQA